MPQNVFSSCNPILVGCVLYTDAGLTIPAADGKYSDGVNVFTVSGGSGIISSSTSCSSVTTSTTTSTTTAAPTTTTTTTTTTSGNNFFVTNAGGSGSITDVDDGSGGYFYVTTVGNFPLLSGEQLEGIQGGITGAAVRVNITSGGVGSCLILYINNVISQTIAVPNSGFYTFSGVTFTSSDLVEIEYVLGSCPP